MKLQDLVNAGMITREKANHLREKAEKKNTSKKDRDNLGHALVSVLQRLEAVEAEVEKLKGGSTGA